MNLHRRNPWALALVAIVLLAFAGVSLAHHAETEANFTTDSAIEVPGKTLDSNTNYELKVLASDTDRHVVQIYTEDERKLVTTFLAESDHMDATTQKGFAYIGTESGHPKAVKSWSQPGLGGLNFVYSIAQARQIAQHSNESVRSTNARITATTTNLDTISVPAIQPGTGERDTRVAANLPATTGELRAAAVGSPPVQVVAEKLPVTAGELPLLALMGILSLGCGAALRLSHSR